ncbi:YlbF family regulator [Lachnospiraceae bacterium NSJ-143]|nr:YlbF family regulator [Lachnospiraceae bacterium NSJ-143]
MGIYDKARELGKEMLECEAAVKLNAAREAFDNSREAQQLVEEYSGLKQKFNEIMADKDSDKLPLTDIGNKITEMEKQIKENEITSGLIKAETEYGAFVNSVFNIINATIQGEDTSSCQGCCSSCTGCH